jgi:hypothetical protein
MGESDSGFGLNFVLAPRGRQRRQIMGVFGWRIALVLFICRIRRPCPDFTSGTAFYYSLTEKPESLPLSFTP